MDQPAVRYRVLVIHQIPEAQATALRAHCAEWVVSPVFSSLAIPEGIVASQAGR
jgi:hypothetical protein